MVYGDGTNSRRYLWAGDATDAFDTVLHKGIVGHTYNVASRYEVINLDLCEKMLGIFGIADTKDWIEYTKDRPFSDRRYAVNCDKLQTLGWTQKTSFEDGLQKTVKWYHDFPNWWGDISHVLTAFPIIEGQAMISFSRNKHTENVVRALRETTEDAEKQPRAGA